MQGMSERQYAAHVGLSRGAIQKAKATGMVKIQIDSPFLPRIALQQDLKDFLGIKTAVVAPADRHNYDYHSAVGAALASHLTERLRVASWSSFGVSWGLTLESAIRKLQRQTHPNLEVVSILGGTSQGSSFNSFGIASGFANALGAQYSILTAPIYLSEGINRDLFLSQNFSSDLYIG